MKILVMGLPGSGKTTLAKVLAKKLSAACFNADGVRTMFNDWDFSEAGRLRQASRMSDLCFLSSSNFTVADFVCPTPETLKTFNPDFVVFMDTISKGRFEDTNGIFHPPLAPNFVISEWGNVDAQVNEIIEKISLPDGVFDWQASTGMMIGRFQPFHEGHVKLFESILEKQGQVVIGVRDTFNIDEKNPLDFSHVMKYIVAALSPKHSGKFVVLQLPNITGVYYGRDVGYTVEQIHLDAATESVSATKIRKSMGL